MTIGPSSGASPLERLHALLGRIHGRHARHCRAARSPSQPRAARLRAARAPALRYRRVAPHAPHATLAAGWRSLRGRSARGARLAREATSVAGHLCAGRRPDRSCRSARRVTGRARPGRSTCSRTRRCRARGRRSARSPGAASCPRGSRRPASWRSRGTEASRPRKSISSRGGSMRERRWETRATSPRRRRGPRVAAGDAGRVVQLPEPYELSAEGKDVYRNFVIPFPVKGLHYVAAWEFRPGRARFTTRSSTLTAWVSPASATQRTRPPASAAWRSATYSRRTGSIWCGRRATRRHRPIRRGPGAVDEKTDLVLQLHMQPRGAASSIHPTIGLYFSSRPPTQQLFGSASRPPHRHRAR